MSAPSNSADVPAQKPEVTKLTVLKMGHQKGIALLNVVKAEGSLEKRLQPQGISVTWNEFSSTAPLLEGMAAGAFLVVGLVVSLLKLEINHLSEKLFLKKLMSVTRNITGFMENHRKVFVVDKNRRSHEITHQS